MFKKSLFAIALSALVMAPAAHAKVYTLTIVNKTSTHVEAFFASPAGVKSWEEDLLGEYAVAPKSRYKVQFEDDRNKCEYDVRFEFRSTDFEPLEDTINLCKINEYEITE